ncbi:MAG: phospholipid-binding protein MlaC [bacterium]
MIRDTAEEVLQIVQKSPPRTKQQAHGWLKKVWHAILPHVDPCEMAMRSLPADYLPHMTKPQKEEFTDIYSRLLMQGYSLALDRYSRNTRFRVVYDEENIEGYYAHVKSRLITPSAEYAISYRLYHDGEKWLIYDVSYDAVSQVENFRAQLERIGRKFSYDYEHLRKRIKERLKPGLKHLPIPQVKMRLWGICQRS